jgi:hypothetical protein
MKSCDGENLAGLTVFDRFCNHRDGEVSVRAARWACRLGMQANFSHHDSALRLRFAVHDHVAEILPEIVRGLCQFMALCLAFCQFYNVP